MGDTALITNFNGCTQQILDGLQDTNTCCSFVYAETHNRPKTKLGRKRKCPKNEKNEYETGPKLANLQFRARKQKRKRNSVGLYILYIICKSCIQNKCPQCSVPSGISGSKRVCRG